MKSLYKKAQEMLEKMSGKQNKRGVFGVKEVATFFGIVLGALLLIYVIIVVMGTIDGAGILTSGSYSANQATAVLQNGSSAGARFAGQLPTIGLILGVMVLILVLLVVARSARQGSSGGI